MKYFLSVIGLLYFSLQGFGQLFTPADYPRDYFRDPLAIPMSLAANFGELRPNHYHMGLDIRTQHRENLPVFAAADGYVSRVSVEPGGFGQAIYITHPNGYTTVYGHLNQFFPALAAYVHKEQYRRESWPVYLEIPPALFPVKKGDFIANSGNTGGSQGPHLHFEIRRTAGDVNLNPLLFGLPVPDQTPPGIIQLAWYDRNKGIYEQSPHLVPVQRTGPVSGGPVPSGATVFLTTAPSLLTVPVTRISFALRAFDSQTGSANPNGIFEADLFEDGWSVIGFQMDRISYDNTRNINAHIDYKTREKGGAFLQHLSFFPGYPFPSIYRVISAGKSVDPATLLAMKDRPADGVLDIGDGVPHKILIQVKDASGNIASLSFQVQYQPSAEAIAPEKADSSEHLPMSPADISTKNFFPGMLDGIEMGRGAFYLSEKSLYAPVPISISLIDFRGSGWLSLHGGISEVFQIGEPWIPLLDPVLVRIDPTAAFDVDTLPGGRWVRKVSKIVMVCVNGGHKDVKRPEWDKDSLWASARFSEFGNYQLVDDRTPPTIKPLGPLEGANLGKASRIAFSVKDDLGSVRNFRAELDGAWLCFTNDKGLAYIYTFDEHCPPGRHSLKVSVEDAAGNKTVKTYHFTR